MNKELFVKKILVLLFDIKQKRSFHKKVNKILKSVRSKNTLVSPPSGSLKQHNNLWRRLGIHPNVTWFRLYGNISGIWDYRYVPEPLYYLNIEPVLNNKAFSKSYSDKNSYYLFLADLGLPRLIISNINGVFYDSGRNIIHHNLILPILNKYAEFIIKPAVDSGGGNRVYLYSKEYDIVDIENSILIKLTELLKSYKKNYLIQEVIKQHPFFHQYNISSLNTVRILTYRSVADETIQILHAVMRVGRTGSITDNQASGGYACGINKDGTLTGKAVDKFGNIYSEVNGVTLTPGLVIEGFKKMVSVAEIVATRFPYARLLGQDLCLDISGNVRLIEVNNVNNEINFYQMLNGPLFGDHTEEIEEWCRNRPKSFVIDFEV